MATASKPKARPVHEVRLGRIKAAVWGNDTESGTRYNVTVQRVYLDDESNWQTSTSFGRDDLPLLMKVLDRAHDWIFEQAQEAAARERDDREGEGERAFH